MSEPSDAAGRKPSVKSAFRALEILELLTTEARPLSFADFQEALGYPKASLHELLRTLRLARWIDLEPSGRNYRLGPRVWEAGLAYGKMLPLEAIARPHMERVRDVTTETVQLAVLDDSEVLYIAMVDGEHMLRLDSSVGLRLQPHATAVGKVLLSDLPASRMREWLRGRKLERYTPTTIVEHEKLLAELEDVRKSGYANDREERTAGAACVAVPVRDHRGVTVAAMSVSAPAVRFAAKQRTRALAELRQAAADLSGALGYSTPLSTRSGR